MIERHTFTATLVAGGAMTLLGDFSKVQQAQAAISARNRSPG